MLSCNNCLLPETADATSFDDTGSCSVCRQIEGLVPRYGDVTVIAASGTAIPGLHGDLSFAFQVDADPTLRTHQMHLGRTGIDEVVALHQYRNIAGDDPDPVFRKLIVMDADDTIARIRRAANGPKAGVLVLRKLAIGDC